MAPNFLDLATTWENLGARWLLEKKVNFVPCIHNNVSGVEIHFHVNQTHFIQCMKGFVPELVLKQRHKVTWKRPTSKPFGSFLLALVKQ